MFPFFTEKHIKHTNTNADLLIVKARVTYVYNCVLKY